MPTLCFPLLRRKTAGPQDSPGNVSPLNLPTQIPPAREGCPSLLRAWKHECKPRYQQLITQGAEVINKPILETSGRASNCTPTACLRWATLLASLNLLDFEGGFAVFFCCCFSSKQCTAIYSVSQKTEKYLWKKDNSCKEWLRRTSHPAENNARAIIAEPAQICNKAAGKQERLWTSYRNKSQTLWSKNQIRDKKERQNWLAVNQTPCGTWRTQFHLSLLQLPICMMAISHLIRLASRGLGSEQCFTVNCLWALTEFFSTWDVLLPWDTQRTWGSGLFSLQTLQSPEVPSLCFPAIAVYLVQGSSS